MGAHQFEYPTTRYSGSKRRVLGFIFEHLRAIRFKSVLDVFGGTASVSLMLKGEGKCVHYNDLLKFNTLIGRALIENRGTTVSDDEIDSVVACTSSRRRLISRNFKGMYYLDCENEWLDGAIQNISEIRNPYKRAILTSCLFQACLAKRPFNLFHRVNLYIRTNRVKRSFGNKTTWERPFEELLRRYVAEYNAAIFDNGKANRVVGGYDAFECPNGVDLVYLDPPYFGESSTEGTNYLAFYHFLEGIADYRNWERKLTNVGANPARQYQSAEIANWSKKANMYASFKRVIERFQDNIIVLSYRDNGIPDRRTIRDLLKTVKRHVTVHSIPNKYVLSKHETKELLFIAK
jgi:adenine-specific DNA-methyltransferase